MENSELLRRLSDLKARCERADILTATPFLSPAEQAEALAWVKKQGGCRIILFGGHTECERRALFFLPSYMETDPTELEDQFCALRLEAAFGEPGHRDYLGALLAFGVRREWLGDIWVSGQTAYVFCLPSVSEHLSGIERVGRVGVRAALVDPAAVPAPERRRREITFTVQSLRLDAAAGELFGISRTSAARLISAGAAKLNDLTCLKPDAPVSPGDVISLRGCGKGELSELGGHSRKGRLFLKAQIYL